MVPEKADTGLGVADLASALPTATKSVGKHRKNISGKPMPPSLPICFAEIWRRRKSTLPAHRRERASLEAVASIIPEEARAFTGEAAAAVYLGALVTSLERLVATTNPVQSSTQQIKRPGKMAKQDKRRLQRKAKDDENTVRDMSIPQLMASASGTREADVMKDEDTSESKAIDSDEDVDLASSLAYLTGLAVSGCSAAVLNAKADQVLNVTLRVYDHVAGHHLVARHTPQIFATVLAVLGSSSWSNPTMQRAHLYLLRQTTDSDAKSRRKARDALGSLLNCARAPIIRSRTSSTTTSFFVNEIKAYNEFFSSTLRNAELEMSQVSSLISLLSCVELVSGFLKPIDAARLSKHLVVVTTKTQPGVMVFAYKALAGLMSRNQTTEHSEGGSLGGQTIPQSDLKKLLLAILQNELPEEPSDDLREAYGRCVQIGGSVYASYFEHAPTSNEMILQCVQREFDMVSPTAQPRCIRFVCAALRNLVGQRWFSTRSDVLGVLQGFMNESFKPIWREVLPVLKAYLEKGMTSGNPAMSDAIRKLLQSLLKKREEAYDRGDQKVIDMLQSLICSIARGGGASHIFEQCKLEYDEKEHVTNAWLLSILRDNIRGAPVNLFSSACMALAAKLTTALDAVKREKRVVEAKNISSYVLQIWGLLPAFCTQPSDLWDEGSLNSLFQAMYDCLTRENNLSMYSIGIGGLRQLSISIESLPSEQPKNESIRLSFASRLKKLYPAISDASEKITDERRGMFMEAVTVACRATHNPAIVLALLRKSVRRLLELRVNMSNGANETLRPSEDNAQAVRQQHAAADLSIAIAESRIMPFDASEVGFLEKALTPFFANPKETALQKKAYRASTLLLSVRGDDPTLSEFTSFLDTLSKSGQTVASGAKAARQSLIATLVQSSLRVNPGQPRVAYLEKLNDMFLSEVIMGTRDVSEKTRAASFETLVAMARTWNASSSGADYSGLKSFFFAVTAGLGARSVPMIASTVTALGRLIYDFRGEALVNEEFRQVVDSMFANVSERLDTSMGDDRTEKREEGSDSVEPGLIAILLRHNDVEVQKAALGVVKVATKVLAEPPTRLTSVLPGIVPGLVCVAAGSKKQEVRLRVRVVFERILRKCGYDALQAVFPPEHMKLLSAVRKKYSRDMLKKHAAKDKRQQQAALKSRMLEPREDFDKGIDIPVEDSDSDVEREILDGDELLKAGMRRIKHSKSKEASDVMDLLDGQARPLDEDVDGKTSEALSRRKQTRASEVVKYSKDGRLILVESDDDSGLAEIGSLSETSDDEDMKRPPRRPLNITIDRKRGRTQTDEEGRHTKRLKGSFGEEYKSLRGPGDVKRAGRPDPYAYVPLGMEMIGPGARPGLIGAKRNRKASSLSKLIRGNRGKKLRGMPRGVPGKR
eukprot:TRINITY_DN70541_c0_g1_i1.p1 TRINITY_DN70541_c0_g1~~TRINITY_DN70541_c0_g1_i1.p1  ORF type:complete len:1393 (-),score=213.10 TRINITY_DN70541_c0_g1_i1:2398-6576(-)